MNAAVKFLGSSDEVTTCDHCGKSELKGTIVLEINEDVVHFGSTCASRALAGRGIKMTAAVIKRRSDSVDQAKRAAEWKAAAKLAKEQTAKWHAWLHTTTGQADAFLAIQSLGGYRVARAQFDAAA